MRPLQLAVELRFKRTRPHMRDAGQADELLEIPVDEQQGVVADDSRPSVKETLQIDSRISQ